MQKEIITEQLWYPAATPELIAAERQAHAVVATGCDKVRLSLADQALGVVHDPVVYSTDAPAIAAFRDDPTSELDLNVATRLFATAKALEILRRTGSGSEPDARSFLVKPNQMLLGQSPARSLERVLFNADVFFSFTNALRAAAEGFGVQPNTKRATPFSVNGVWVRRRA
jgi:hypothetical protein